MAVPITSEDRVASADVKRLTILGSTGSIGCSTIDLVTRNRERFDVVALVGNANIPLLARQAVDCAATLAVTADESRYGELAAALEGTGIAVAAGEKAVIEAASRPADLVVAAIVGAAGLKPTLAAVSQGTTVALANKECLVCAGSLFMEAAAAAEAAVVPVDSEHSAVFQVFEQDNAHRVSRVILTASGGPFRTLPAEALASVSPEQALKHPNWSMGPKVTIDSATLMNKGLELIEAFHLFPLALEQLDVLVHPQSIVHSLVEYEDGSVLAQLGMPDMRTPIALALAWPDRMATPVDRLRLEEIGSLTFEAVDHQRFPAVGLCLAALSRGDNATTLLNAANEVAVDAFLSKSIKFQAINRTVRTTLEVAERQGMVTALGSLDDVWMSDAYGRRIASELARQLHD